MSTLRRYRWGKIVALVATGFLGFSYGNADAGGFFVRQQSVSAQSTAFAGAAARGVDPSHLFFNGATIADNPGASYTLDFRLFLPDVEINARRATSLLGADVTRRGDSGSMADTALAPGLFASTAITEDFFIGVGVTAPFAVVIETDPIWAGQFQLLRTDMTTYNVNPVFSWKVRPGITISGGLQVQRFEADLRKTEILPVGPFVFAEAQGFLKGDDTSLGVTAGLLLEPFDGLRIGAGYRSEINHRLMGTAGADLQGIPEDRANFDVTTPQMVTLGVEAQITDRIALLGEVEWIDWSVFNGFVIDFESGRPTEIRPQDWRDTWFYSAGVRIKVDERTQISAGASYDQGISTGASNTLSPDGNRTGVAFGLTREVSETSELRFSYMHLFIADAPINTRNQSGTLLANFESDLDVFGVSWTLRR